jgi:hypothetical protein
VRRRKGKRQEEEEEEEEEEGRTERKRNPRWLKPPAQPVSISKMVSILPGQFYLRRLQVGIGVFN